MNVPARRLFTLAAMVAGLAAAGCGSDGGGGSVTPTTSSRPWVDEAEFSGDASLHAAPEQVVILHLDPKPAGSDLVEHTVRYQVKDAADLGFCIPANEPHVTHLELGKAPGGQTMVRAERGGDCSSVTLSPGTYELRAFHDGTKVPAQGTTAFLHRRATRASRRTAPRAGDGSGAASPFVVPDFMAFRYLGQWVGAYPPYVVPAAPLVAKFPEFSLLSVFRLTATTTPNSFNLEVGVAKVNVGTPDGSNYLIYVGSSTDLPATWGAWEFQDEGNGQFSICSPSNGCVAVSPTANFWNAVSSYLYLTAGVGSTFTVDYKGYDCTPTACEGSALNLQEGDVALFGRENWQGPAFVFRADVPDFGIYRGAAPQLAIGADMVRSVRVGPDTLAYLYENANYGGSAIGVASDVPSLAGTASSMQVDLLGAYVATTRACENCILTGADLSGLDLTGADFSGAKLANVDLSGTKLREARLDGAVLSGTTLSGTDFTAASLQCTDFSDADLTEAQFASLLGPLLVVDGAGIIVKTDPVSGARAQVSGGETGSGTPLREPNGVALGSDGTLWVVDLEVGVLRVDPLTGARTVVAAWPFPGDAAQIGSPSDIAVDSAGQVLVGGPHGVAQVDPVSGTTSLLSGPTQGTGPSFLQATGIAIDGAGRVIVVDADLRALIAIDPATGNRTVLSNDDAGTGPHFVFPGSVAIDGQGNLFVADYDFNAPVVFKVDPSSGDRTLVSGTERGTGPSFNDITGIAADLNGTLVVTDVIGDRIPGVVLRVDPTTGDRTTVSDAGTGAGPQFSQGLAGLAIAPTIATDFSCRLIANGATIDAGLQTQTFPLASWRYMDLTNAVIRNATLAPLSTTTAPLDLSGAILSGASGLSGAVLDGVNLDCATPSQQEWHCSQLIGTELRGASLQSAKAVNASMQGSNLDYTNLLGADLSAAMIGAAQSDTPGPASMFGAYMPNVNLSSADLRFVDLTGAHLYGSAVSLAGTLLDGANLSNAICDGAQFTSASLAGAVLNGAQLVNCGFAMADLTDASFDSSYLQGADFSGAAKVEGVRLNNVAVSIAPGAWSFMEQDGTQFLYQFEATMLGALATDTSVICPSGDSGGCVGEKLTPVTNGPFPPIPACVPMPPDYDNCLPPVPPS